MSRFKFRIPARNLFRKISTALSLLFRGNLEFADFSKAKLIPGLKEASEQQAQGKTQSSIALVSHIHYREYLPQMVEIIKNFPNQINLSIYVTTSIKDIYVEAGQLLGELPNNHKIILAPNIGRNFAPMFVELSNELLKFDLIAHWHSKKSPHAANRLSQTWAAQSLRLLTDREILNRSLSLLEANSKIGLVYTDTFRLFRRINLKWGANWRQARKIQRYLLPKAGILQKQPMNFPVGSMFVAKTSALRPLLEVNWSYSDFTAELNQVDGQLHHAIERAIGQVAFVQGFGHCIYTNATDRFVIVEKNSVC